MLAAKFREYAAEHLDWAETAKSDRERQTFEQMARAWLEAAALWESASQADVEEPIARDCYSRTRRPIALRRGRSAKKYLRMKRPSRP